MKAPLISLLPLLLVSWLTGCSSVQVKSHKAPEVDLASYSTFNFKEGTDAKQRDEEILTRQNWERVKKAVRSELSSLNYTEAAQPELMVSIYLRVADRVFEQRTPDLQGGSMFYNMKKYYGFQYNYDHEWNEEHEVEYREGTLVIDLVDVAKARLVWQGVAVGVLYENPSDEQVEERIREAVGAIFKQFPR